MPPPVAQIPSPERNAKTRTAAKARTAVKTRSAAKARTAVKTRSAVRYSGDVVRYTSAVMSDAPSPDEPNAPPPAARPPRTGAAPPSFYETPPPELVEGDAIVTDLPCVQCGYNLRMALVESVCPECGTPVSETLSAALQRPGRDRWLAHVAHGLQGILLGGGVLLLAPLLGMLQPALGVFCGLFGAVALFVGVQAALEPEPLGEPAAQRVPRWFATVAMYALPACALVLAGGYARRIPPVAELGAVALWIVGSAVPCALLLYFAGVARRLPDAGLAGYLRFAGVAWAVLGAAQVLANVLSLAARITAGPVAAASAPILAATAPLIASPPAAAGLAASPTAAERLGAAAGSLQVLSGVLQFCLLFATLALLALLARGIFRVLHRLAEYRDTRSLFEP